MEYGSNNRGRDDLNSTYCNGNYRNTVFSTPTDQNNNAKLQAKEIQCKTKTDRGKEVFLNVCSTLNEKMISIVALQLPGQAFSSEGKDVEKCSCLARLRVEVDMEIFFDSFGS